MRQRRASNRRDASGPEKRFERGHALRTNNRFTGPPLTASCVSPIVASMFKVAKAGSPQRKHLAFIWAKSLSWSVRTTKRI